MKVVQVIFARALSGFQLAQATGISPDGKYITGFTGDFGDRTAWLVELPTEIPEPASMLIRNTSAACRR